jgi:hypothetical protein
VRIAEPRGTGRAPASRETYADFVVTTDQISSRIESLETPTALTVQSFIGEMKQLVNFDTNNVGKELTSSVSLDSLFDIANKSLGWTNSNSVSSAF